MPDEKIMDNPIQEPIKLDKEDRTDLLVAAFEESDTVDETEEEGQPEATEVEEDLEAEEVIEYVDEDGNPVADEDVPAESKTDEPQEEAEDGPVTFDREAYKDQMVTIKQGDTETRITVDEALSGYSRLEDYRKKTEDLSNDREKFQVIVQQAQQWNANNQQMLSDVLNTVNQINPLLAELDNKEEMAKLSVEDPLEYSSKIAQGELLQQQIQHVAASRDYLAAEQYQQRLQQNKAEIMATYPDFANKEKRHSELKLIVKTLTDLGVSEREIQEIDARTLLLARKAALWDQSQVNIKSVDGKKVVKRVVKTLKPKAAVQQNRNVDSDRRVAKLNDKAVRSGNQHERIDALAAALENTV